MNPILQTIKKDTIKLGYNELYGTMGILHYRRDIAMFVQICVVICDLKSSIKQICYGRDFVIV